MRYDSRGCRAPAERPELAAALRLRDGGDTGALVAAKVDRVARDLDDLTGLVLRADGDGWAVVAPTSEWARRCRSTACPGHCAGMWSHVTA